MLWREELNINMKRTRQHLSSRQTKYKGRQRITAQTKGRNTAKTGIGRAVRD